jgi:hypothetical protein
VTRLLTFSHLRALSYTHSVIYVALLVAWLVPGLGGATLVLGWAHGTMWILMSLLCLEAVRRHVIPFRLAVIVVVLGGLGPFAGSAAFAWESRRVPSLS